METRPEAQSFGVPEILHNQRIIAVSVVAAAAVVGSLLYTNTISYNRQTTQTPNTAPQKPEQNEATRTLPQQDDNENGIPDWQELPHTDPTTADTAGTTPPPTRDALEKVYTKTDLLAGDLFGSYLERKEAGSYSTADAGAIIREALAGLAVHNIPTYTSESLTILPGETDADAQEYKQQMTALIEKIRAAIPEYELQTYARATEKNDPAEFEKLAQAGEVYAGIVYDLKALPVPKDAVRAHLALMNGFAKVALALHAMARGYDDIAGSYAALGTFGEAEKDINYAYTLHQAYLSSHNAF